MQSRVAVVQYRQSDHGAGEAWPELNSALRVLA